MRLLGKSVTFFAYVNLVDFHSKSVKISLKSHILIKGDALCTRIGLALPMRYVPGWAGLGVAYILSTQMGLALPMPYAVACKICKGTGAVQFRITL